MEHFREQITNFGLQGPINHRSDGDIVESLHDAVIGIDFTEISILQCVSVVLQLEFYQLNTALDTAWMQHQKIFIWKRT